MEEVEEVGLSWLRWWVGTRRDIKWRSLSPEGRSLFSALLEIARECDMKGTVCLVPGLPYSDEQLADEAAIPVSAVRPQLEKMKALGMIEERADEIFLVNFAKRQFESDSSTERVKRHRDKKRERNGDETLRGNTGNVSATAPDYRLQTTDKDINVRGEYCKSFEEFWGKYQRKVDKKGASQCWNARIHEGMLAVDLLRYEQNYNDVIKREGTPVKYIMHPSTFLGPNERWKEFAEPVAVVKEDFRPAAQPVSAVVSELEALLRGDVS